MKCKMIIDEYDRCHDMLVRQRDIVVGKIKETLKSAGMEVTAVEARVKTRGSLIGKLLRKGYMYNSLSDITDLMGARVITLFSDDVDRAASYMTDVFDIDWARSTDKRKMHELDSFGYNSLHYICRLPQSVYADENCPEINSQRFEVQLRSTLQHAWAAMEHDIGYKTEIETPPEYQRMFGRLASLLELADEEFARIRISVADYRRRMEALIRDGALSEVRLDGETWAAYTSQKPFDKLTRRIAAINQGEIHDMPFEPFFVLVKEAGMETLQDVEDFIRQNENDAYQLAMAQFAATDIDIVASTVGLQNLLFVGVLKNGGGRAALRHVFDVVNGRSEHNDRLAGIVFAQASKLPFMGRSVK